MSDPSPTTRKRLAPWLANELRDALDARDVDTLFALIGGYLEQNELRMPAKRLAEWRERSLIEDVEPPES